MNTYEEFDRLSLPVILFDEDGKTVYKNICARTIKVPRLGANIRRFSTKDDIPTLEECMKERGSCVICVGNDENASAAAVFFDEKISLFVVCIMYNVMAQRAENELSCLREMELYSSNSAIADIYREYCQNRDELVNAALNDAVICNTRRLSRVTHHFELTACVPSNVSAREDAAIYDVSEVLREMHILASKSFGSFGYNIRAQFSLDDFLFTSVNVKAFISIYASMLEVALRACENKSVTVEIGREFDEAFMRFRFKCSDQAYVSKRFRSELHFIKEACAMHSCDFHGFSSDDRKCIMTLKVPLSKKAPESNFTVRACFAKEDTPLREYILCEFSWV